MTTATRTLILITMLLSPLGCALGGSGKPVNWPELARCGPGVSDIIGSVSEVLLGTSDVGSQLESLAYTHGTDTVVCGVERLRTDWSAPGAASSPARASGVARADAWLDVIGTEIEQGS